MATFFLIPIPQAVVKLVYTLLNVKIHPSSCNLPTTANEITQEHLVRAPTRLSCSVNLSPIYLQSIVRSKQETKQPKYSKTMETQLLLFGLAQQPQIMIQQPCSNIRTYRQPCWIRPKEHSILFKAELRLLMPGKSRKKEHCKYNSIPITALLKAITINWDFN